MKSIIEDALARGASDEKSESPQRTYLKRHLMSLLLTNPVNINMS